MSKNSAIIHLEVYLDTLYTNSEVNRHEGNIEQAEAEESAIADVEEALEILRAELE